MEKWISRALLLAGLALLAIPVVLLLRVGGVALAWVVAVCFVILGIAFAIVVKMQRKGDR